MYTHSSQVNIEDLVAGTLAPNKAQELAEIFKLEAFHDSLTEEWIAFSDDCDDIVSIDDKLIIRILNYSKGKK